jgi:hypothetical protein
MYRRHHHRIACIDDNPRCASPRRTWSLTALSCTRRTAPRRTPEPCPQQRSAPSHGLTDTVNPLHFRHTIGRGHARATELLDEPCGELTGPSTTIQAGHLFEHAKAALATARSEALQERTDYLGVSVSRAAPNASAPPAGTHRSSR